MCQSRQYANHNQRTELILYQKLSELYSSQITRRNLRQVVEWMPWFGFYHGCPSFSFEMSKFTRSICHKKVKFINKREQKLKKQAIATAFKNILRDFWSEISKIRKKIQNNKCLVECKNDDKAISLGFSDHYKQLSTLWISHLVSGRSCIIMFVMILCPIVVIILSTVLCYYLNNVMYIAYLHVCYHIVLYPHYF